ncbi:unnamed protein product, partial [Prorocentrum cordatum]
MAAALRSSLLGGPAGGAGNCPAPWAPACGVLVESVLGSMSAAAVAAGARRGRELLALVRPAVEEPEVEHGHGQALRREAQPYVPPSEVRGGAAGTSGRIVPFEALVDGGDEDDDSPVEALTVEEKGEAGTSPAARTIGGSVSDEQQLAVERRGRAAAAVHCGWRAHRGRLAHLEGVLAVAAAAEAAARKAEASPPETLSSVGDEAGPTRAGEQERHVTALEVVVEGGLDHGVGYDIVDGEGNEEGGGMSEDSLHFSRRRLRACRGGVDVCAMCRPRSSRAMECGECPGEVGRCSGHEECSIGWHCGRCGCAVVGAPTADQRGASERVGARYRVAKPKLRLRDVCSMFNGSVKPSWEHQPMSFDDVRKGKDSVGTPAIHLRHHQRLNSKHVEMVWPGEEVLVLHLDVEYSKEEHSTELALEPRLRAKVRTDSDKVGWITVEMPGEVLLEPRDLYNTKAVSRLRKHGPFPRRLPFRRRSARSGSDGGPGKDEAGPALEEGTLEAWERTGAIFRALRTEDCFDCKPSMGTAPKWKVYKGTLITI